MSYIHDALKKAQREKDVLAGKYSQIWSSDGIGKVFQKRDWFISLGIVAIAFAFSSFAWLSSLDELAMVPVQQMDPSTPSIHRGKITPPMPTTTSRRPSVPSETAEAKPPPGVEKRMPIARPQASERRVIGAPLAQPQPQRPIAQSPKKQTTQAQTGVVTTSPPPSRGTGSLYSRALSLQKSGRIEEAKKLYEAALRKTPNLVSALNNLATIYIQQQNLEGARAFLEKAIRIDPEYVDAYYNLACTHARNKDVARGIFYLKKAITLNPIAREWAKRDEDLKNLRNHTEFAEIIHGEETS